MSAPVPSFDEWFLAKYGRTFKEAHCQPGMWINDSMEAMANHARDYLTDMVARVVSPQPATATVPWGKFDPRDGTWSHNPLLMMSAEEQRRANEANGFICRVKP